ncbi:protein SLX4IP isoform X3 [Hemicordylus capensis]|uniref:protein SLX4IP isoform X3 n=1 Tax=Hemicordylus capensis TaxID=884348 RepID=UPI00230346AE|nr:protein SLX4IP isoform X3 [Hemicordylus capensis]XP_053141771.1 protein SLX4IP isoform X3 [Hemicordylus capensis]
MNTHKLVIKCGKFAVLVDFHIMPQDSSKDTTWFPNKKKEEVCMLLKDTVDSRVKQYLKAHKRHDQLKQMEYANPLSLIADGFHIAAYFVKRWVNLRCIGGQQQSGLRVFPDRFVICVTRLESSPSPWVSESVAPDSSTFSSLSDEKLHTMSCQSFLPHIWNAAAKNVCHKLSYITLDAHPLILSVLQKKTCLLERLYILANQLKMKSSRLPCLNRRSKPS